MYCESLKEKITTGLLTFFDRIDYGANINLKNYKLIIRGYRKVWVAINTFFIDDWYVIDQDEFIAAMGIKISFLQENYDKLFTSVL